MNAETQKLMIAFIDESVKESQPKTAGGMLSKYAIKDKDINAVTELEKTAWAEAAVEKHEKHFKNL
ncbi:MAG: hypothetical protein FWG45_00245 [Oscillospiraceae bacterium]|nr:hypothetical protein [Oscillospiraceae bacterium]